MKKAFGFLSIVLAAVVVSLIVFFYFKENSPKVVSAPIQMKAATEKTESKLPKKTEDFIPKTKKKTDPKRIKALNVHKPVLARYSDALYKELLQSALDRDNMAGVMALAQKAANSDDDALRMQALEALGWYGEATLDQMMIFLQDKNEKISEKAYELIDHAIDGVDGSANKSRLIAKVVMSALTEDEAISMLAKFETVDQYFGTRQLIKIYEKIDQNSVLAELVRDEYKFITGKSLISVEYAKELNERFLLQQKAE